MYEGKTYSFTFDHKPTVKEVDELFKLKSGRNFDNKKATFYDAATEMLEIKSNVLKPSTIRGYTHNLEKLSDEFKNMKIDDIQQKDLQKELNRLAETRAPKTVKNYKGFIDSVFALYCPSVNFNVKIPMVVTKEPYIPKSEEVKTIIDLSRGTPYQLPVYLGCYGMRRSEICALTLKDINFDTNEIHITKSKTQNEREEWVITNTPKTSKSYRTIQVHPLVIQLIKENGLYKGHPHTISDWLRRTQDKINMPRFSLHKLRHYYASEMLEDMPMKAVQEFGGWSSAYTVQRIYNHNRRKTAEIEQAMSSKLF